MNASSPQRSQRPYLIRAIYEWVLDCAHTPYLLVAANEPGVEVPQGFVGEDGRIVLNLNPSAVQGMQLTNDMISFSARFAGVVHQVFVPPRAVLAVYAKETGAGMLFGEPEEAGSTEASAAPHSASHKESGPDDTPPAPKGGRGHLRVVK